MELARIESVNDWIQVKQFIDDFGGDSGIIVDLLKTNHNFTDEHEECRRRTQGCTNQLKDHLNRVNNLDNYPFLDMKDGFDETQPCVSVFKSQPHIRDSNCGQMFRALCEDACID